MIKAIESTISTSMDKRFVIIDTETGEILDNAQGYGYKTAQKAYAGYSYKKPLTQEQREKRKERRARERMAKKWLNENKYFRDAMNQYCFEVEYKGSWGPDVRFNTKFVKEMLAEDNIEVDFTAGELLRAWKKL